ncbi:MAG TPA: hypothetical protein DCQ26_03900 [Marinilabiliales bacterium]|nr:hypothetical protein [Marinilabiliales bacterium]HBX86328.1 hypothetical protein [Marinilabiliales bacterium]HBY53068.1 hypothetical protein [Marinilabiliales bacterium]
MDNQLENSIKGFFEKNPILKTGELIGLLQNIYPHTTKSTIYWRLYNLKSNGIIKQMGRGVYALNRKPDFAPVLSPVLVQLHKIIQKNFPYVNFCVWDSYWFNEFMVHQAFKRHYIIEVEKDATESVFYRLTEKNKNVFLNPQKDMFGKYIANYDEAVIIIPMISESPVVKIKKVNIPSLEKLLVDCLVGDEIFATQQNDLDYIIQTAFERYNINPAKMRRYANRRNIKDKIENILIKYSANII